MTDIDFDELDKAVNSLMNQRSDQSATSESAAPSVSATDVTPATAQTAVPAASTSPTPSAVSTPSAPIVSPSPTEAFVAPSPAIAKRPAGRFMDVVHPSSDMTNNRPAQPRPSRSGVSLQPMSQPVTDGTGSAAAPELAPTEPVAMPATAAELAMADALDKMPVAEPTVTEELTEEASVSESASLTADVVPTTPADTELADKIAASLRESAAATPLESPFLTDAVVEKRPLGSAPEVAVPELSTADTTSEVAPVNDDAETELAAVSDASTEWNETPKGDMLAPELGKDIMAIESSEVTASEPATAAPAIGADIPQQYTPTTDDAPEPAPMFDAASLTPEHDAAPKKKSGVLTVLLILLFALLGVAGGAAAYFFLLQ